MPYASYLYCEDCGDLQDLDIDYAGTISAYIKDGKKPAAINPPTLIWDYLIYNCPRCHAQFKYTYRDVEARVREHFVRLSDKYRKYFDDRGIYDERIDAKAARKIDITEEARKRVERLYTKK